MIELVRPRPAPSASHNKHPANERRSRESSSADRGRDRLPEINALACSDGWPPVALFRPSSFFFLFYHYSRELVCCVKGARLPFLPPSPGGILFVVNNAGGCMGSLFFSFLPFFLFYLQKSVNCDRIYEPANRGLWSPKGFQRFSIIISFMTQQQLSGIEF